MKSTAELVQMKGRQQITMLTCYDHAMARILDTSPLDIVLVGDTMGEVLYGHPHTSEVSMDIMLRHVEAVSRGLKSIHLMADMPHKSYTTADKAVKNAKSIISAGAVSVKLENPSDETVQALRAEGIEVCGHVGLTPQTNHDYQLQGRDQGDYDRILADAVRLDDAGCFIILVEAVTSALAAEITGRVRHPTVGISSGRKVDGQVLVINDMLGFDDVERSYVKKYADLKELISRAVAEYCRDTRQD